MKRTKAGVLAFILAFITALTAFPAVSYAEEVDCYTLVTSLSDITDGDRVLIAAHSGDKIYVASTRKLNNRTSVEALTENGIIYGNAAVATGDASAYEFTVGVENGYYSFYDAVYGGYLCAIATGTSSRMYTSETLTDACLFGISMDGEGACTPIAKDTSLNGKMVFVSTTKVNEIFTCVPASNNSYQNVYLYKYNGKDTAPEVDESSETVNYLCTFDTFVAEHYSSTETVKYSGTYSGAILNGFIYVFSLNDSLGRSINSKNLDSDDILADNNTFYYSYTLTNEAVSEYSQPFKVSVRCVHAPQAIEPASTTLQMLTAPIENVTVTFTASEGGALEGAASITVPKGTELSTVVFPNAVANDDSFEFVGWSMTSGVINEDTTITASFAKKDVTLTFVASEGGYIDGEASFTVPYGTELSTVVFPNAVANDGYTFGSWDKTEGIITENTVITAYFVKTHLVTFVDHDGKELDTQYVVDGMGATAPANPTREHYTFNGWNKEFDCITEATVITATYIPAQYLVTFVDYDGRVIDSVYVTYGNGATAPADPTREGYNFTGWDTEFDNVSSELTVTATYKIKTYSVTFYDYDGRKIVTRIVNHGGAARPPQDPTREGYDFVDWDKDFSNVTENLSVTATYKIKTFTVTFVAGVGGSVSGNSSVTVNYGTEIASLSFPAVSENTGFDFDRWDYEGDTVNKNITITALFKAESYTVTFVAGTGGSVSGNSSVTVDYGTAISSIAFPAVSANEGYVFLRWDYVGSTVTGNMTITAVFEEKPALLRGDANGDGKVDSYDASLILRHDAALITLVDEYAEAADVNGDGFIDCYDALLVLLHDAGKINLFN